MNYNYLRDHVQTVDYIISNSKWYSLSSLEPLGSPMDVDKLYALINIFHPRTKALNEEESIQGGTVELCEKKTKKRV